MYVKEGSDLVLTDKGKKKYQVCLSYVNDFDDFRNVYITTKELQRMLEGLKGEGIDETQNKVLTFDLIDSITDEVNEISAVIHTIEKIPLPEDEYHKEHRESILGFLYEYLEFQLTRYKNTIC